VHLAWFQYYDTQDDGSDAGFSERRPVCNLWPANIGFVEDKVTQTRCRLYFRRPLSMPFHQTFHIQPFTSHRRYITLINSRRRRITHKYTKALCFTPVYFTPFFPFNAPCQLTPLHNLRYLIFCLTSFSLVYLYLFQPFLALWHKCEKVTISFVSLAACNNSASTGRIFMKIWCLSSF
jgi:hypothetical protein